MAGNNSIQFLRGAGHNSTAQLLPGQPYYDYTNNKLYIGGYNGTAINKAEAIGDNVRIDVQGSSLHAVKVNLSGLGESVGIAICNARLTDLNNSFTSLWTGTNITAWLFIVGNQGAVLEISKTSSGISIRNVALGSTSSVNISSFTFTFLGFI